MQVEEYIAASAAKARDLVSTETDLAVLRDLRDKDARKTVQNAVTRRLRLLEQLSGDKDPVTDPAPERPVHPTLVPGPDSSEKDSRVPEAEEPVRSGSQEVLPPEAGEATTSRRRSGPRGKSSKGKKALALAKAAALEDSVWTCKKTGCGHSGPPQDFGIRTVNGRKYRQPWCRPCRRVASKLSRQRKKNPVSVNAVEPCAV